ncbi:phospholipase D-like domain-containing protein [Actinomadura flavalba]|uniref:phospholipase D-like domain-containing protein n=1 Tax=Actinomadura flavalba TaxID=1120938 RepID=UPI000368CEE8|nr:phospholipase D-like domain-containing protein [Actinomadura flavalba]
MITALAVGFGGPAVSAAGGVRPRPALSPAIGAFAEKRPKVPEGPLFNQPTGTAKQAESIDRYVRGLIADTPKGASIDVALFRLRTAAMAKALVQAHGRGVRVRVVLDSDSPKAQADVYKTLVKSLGTRTAKASWVTLCPARRGCIADRLDPDDWSKNHNKFYAFSKTRGTANVVVQTSANATGAMSSRFNDAYTSTDATLYKGYRRYFQDLAAKKPNKNYWRTVTSQGVSVGFFPKASGDPVLDALRKVACAGGTRVRVTSGLFTRAPIAEQLSALGHGGCDVRIAAGILGANASKALARAGTGPGPQTRYFTGRNAHAAHSKYLLIDGLFEGRKRRLVFVGSHNYTWDALRSNDEAMLTIDNAATFNAYLANFGRVFAAANGRVKVGTPVPPVPPPVTPSPEEPEPSEASQEPEPVSDAPEETPSPAEAPAGSPAEAPVEPAPTPEVSGAEPAQPTESPSTSRRPVA